MLRVASVTNISASTSVDVDNLSGDVSGFIARQPDSNGGSIL
jgi:hypothetical protein